MTWHALLGAEIAAEFQELSGPSYDDVVNAIWQTTGGLHPETIRWRVERGMTRAEAVQTPATPPGERRPAKPDGVLARARRAGIPFRTVQTRMRNGMSLDEALSAVGRYRKR